MSKRQIKPAPKTDEQRRARKVTANRVLTVLILAAWA